MVLHEFPDLHWLKKNIENDFEAVPLPVKNTNKKGWPSVVLNVENRAAVRDNIKGPISIFCNLKGQSRVVLENKAVLIPEGTFLISNQDQLYNLETFKNTETFNIHFGADISTQALGAMDLSMQQILDGRFSKTPLFHNHLIQQDGQFQALCKQLLHVAKNTLQKEEILFALALYMAQQYRKQTNTIHNLSPTKKSTKEEVYKRLSFATDFIYSNFHLDINLATLAQQSAMSKFHFLRLFKAVHHYSPHQFITSLRIKKAENLLKTSNKSIDHIAQEVGLNNGSSLSRLFYQKTGAYPSTLRK